MTRLLLLLALFVVVGCGPGPSGLSPDDAFRASLAAVGEGDVPQALALLDEAAQAGHLGALEYRARSYRHGYLRTDWFDGWQAGRIEETHPFLVLPGQAESAQADYRRALEAAADADDLDALFLLAAMWDEQGWYRHDGAPAQQDSARAVYRRLVDLGADPFRLAILASNLDLRDDHRRHLQAATEAGNPVACLQLSYVAQGRTFSAQSVAQSIDDYESCRRLAQAAQTLTADFDQSDRTLSTLSAQVRDGNDSARAILDSLRADGVFERHPRLAAVVAG